MLNLHHRTARLPEFDYSSPGAYFITVVTWQRESILGEIIGGEMVLNEFGKIVNEEWQNTATIRPEIELDAFQIMPNHFHGILFIHESITHADIGLEGPAHKVGTHGRASLPDPLRPQFLHRKPRSLGSCVAGLKSIITKRINVERHTPGTPVWQRNYYEHILRTEDELQRIRAYIEANPVNWQMDDENTGGA